MKDARNIVPSRASSLAVSARRKANAIAVTRAPVAKRPIIPASVSDCRNWMFRASFIWLLALVLGNQAAVWLIPSSYVARLLWVLLGIAVAVQRLSTRARESAISDAKPQELAFA